MTNTRASLGPWGESAAAKHLEQQGYTLLQRNWYCPYGEIDLVMMQDETLVFVEVKTRRQSLTAAFASITPAKREKLVNAAEYYLTTHYPDAPPDWRIDVVAVTLTDGQIQIEHVEDALDW